MPDREKVINGLEVCISREPGKYTCYECPYETVGNDCEIKMLKDAISLLKEKEVPDATVDPCKSCQEWECDGCEFCKEVTGDG